MKRIFSFLLPATILFGCETKNTGTESTATADSTSKMDNTRVDVTLPYTVARTPDWERGEANHVAIAMNTLRAFEVNDMNAIRQNLADSVEFYNNEVNFKGSRDSLIGLFTKYRGSLDTMFVRMHDYESVKSKNRGEEWVGLWYTETVKRKGEKIDSMMTMDDIKIVNGKVAIIDSKRRRLLK